MHHFSDYYDSFEEAQAAAEKVIAEQRKSSAEKSETFIEGNWIAITRKFTDNRKEGIHRVTAWNIEKNYDGKFYFYTDD